jgi:predicted small lipoprotein YifL
MRAVIAGLPPYTGRMLRTAILLVMTLGVAACGMKGDLYLPPETPDERITAPVPDPAEPAGENERRTIPATPDPALAR